MSAYLRPAVRLRPAFAWVAAIGLAACFLALLPGTAHADYRLCNETSYVLKAAIGYGEDDKMASQGWFSIWPGNCATAFQGDIDRDTYYVYAKSIAAHNGPVKYFSGGSRFCVTEGDFKIEGRNACARRGFDFADFIRIKTIRGKSWTTSFTEPANYTTRQARIAGTQRLLRDNGITISSIDGHEGNRTAKAVRAFEKKAGLSGSGVITDSLIEKLISSAESAQAKVGLDLCNDTSYLVWSAIAYDGTDEKGKSIPMSSGWIRIAPDECRKAIKGALSDKPYYVYGEAVDERGEPVRRDGGQLKWSGKETFCTKPTRFDIKGRSDCAARGFDSREFVKIDPGGKPLLKYEFE